VLDSAAAVYPFFTNKAPSFSLTYQFDVRKFGRFIVVFFFGRPKEYDTAISAVYAPIYPVNFYLALLHVTS
jgi:hypothetical protein